MAATAQRRRQMGRHPTLNAGFVDTTSGVILAASNGHGKKNGFHTKAMEGERMHPKRQREDGKDAKLDASVEALLHKRPSDYPPQDWVSVREQLRLTLLYPGRFVAFRDHYKGVGTSRRLTLREVLHASRSLAALNKHLDKLPERDRRDVLIDYVEHRKSR